MKRPILIALAGLSVVSAEFAARAQPAAPQDAQTPALSSQTTLVVVPALVRTKAGEPVFALSAEDFALTDDGVPQKLTLEQEMGAQPLALAVVIEVGGAGAREFDKLGPLTPMLESIAGNVPHQVGIISFDSQPQLVQDFTWDPDRAAQAVASLTENCQRKHYLDACKDKSSIHHLSDGDNGAAILDSLSYAVDLLDLLPTNYRRAILLISETVDRGSHTTVEEAVRAISDTNTTIYSVGFSTAKSEAEHYANREFPTQRKKRGAGIAFENAYSNPAHGCMGKETDPDPDLTNNRLARFYDCAGQLAQPLALAKIAAIAATDGLRGNVPETVARLTGGEYFKLTNAISLERDLTSVSNHIPNRYVLTYHPQAPHPGFHSIGLSLPNHSDLQVTARTSYWVDTPTAPAR
jgi:VWFA-related protein